MDHRPADTFGNATPLSTDLWSGKYRHAPAPPINHRMPPCMAWRSEIAAACQQRICPALLEGFHTDQDYISFLQAQLFTIRRQLAGVGSQSGWLKFSGLRAGDLAWRLLVSLCKCLRTDRGGGSQGNPLDIHPESTRRRAGDGRPFGPILADMRRRKSLSSKCNSHGH